MPKYIDADALMQTIRDHHYLLRDNILPSVDYGMWTLGIQQAVDEIPAADVESKREIAPWKVAGTFDDFHQCTKCGNMWPIFSTVEWAYCPVCGCRKFPDPPKGENDVG